MNLGVTWETLLALAGGFVLLAQAVRIVISMFSPIQEIKRKMEKQEAFLASDKERLDKLDKAIERLDDALSMLGLAVGDLIDHEVTGNGNEKLMATRKKLNEFFYDRKGQK